jgi:hypothetical protein
MPAPLLQGKNVFHGKFALSGAVKEMLKKFRWQVQPFLFSASALTLMGDSTAEGHAREFLAKTSCFGRICGFLETVSEFKERCSPLFIRHDRVRQEIDDGTIRGNVAAHGDSINLLSHLSGERNTPSDGFRFCKSRIHVHHSTPNYTKSQLRRALYGTSISPSRP